GPGQCCLDCRAFVVCPRRPDGVPALVHGCRDGQRTSRCAAKACGRLSGATFRLASATPTVLEGNGGRVGEIGGGNACLRSFRQMRAVWNRGQRRNFRRKRTISLPKRAVCDQKRFRRTRTKMAGSQSARISGQTFGGSEAVPCASAGDDERERCGAGFPIGSKVLRA